jgi:antitoxin FitA
MANRTAPRSQIIVRNLEERVKRKLQRRAVRHGQSMEEEIRDILRDAVKDEGRHHAGLGSEIAALFKTMDLDRSAPRLRIKLKIPKFD